MKDLGYMLELRKLLLWRNYQPKETITLIKSQTSGEETRGREESRVEEENWKQSRKGEQRLMDNQMGQLKDGGEREDINVRLK